MSDYSQAEWTVFYDTMLTRERVFINVAFYEQEDIVEAIHLHGEGAYDPQAFQEIWASFAPENILPLYGVPSRVWIEANSTFGDHPSSNTLPYSLWLFYDQQGFLIRYHGQVEMGPTYQLCTTFDNTGNVGYTLDVYLKSPDSDILLEGFTEYTEMSPKPLTLEEAADMTIDEFYALYQQKDKPICIETPHDIWP